MFQDEFLWCEKYRPKTVSECILPERIKTILQTFVDNKEIPNLLLTSSPGTGKTSVAKALCNEIGCDYLFLNGSSENGIDVFRTKITNYASCVSLTGGKKAIIIDEADYLTQNSFAALRGIESFSKLTSFILTGNYVNKFPEAILSRFSVIDFTLSKAEKKDLIGKFFKRVCYVLEQENVNYNKEVVATVVKKHYPDNRKILNELQKYSAHGDIDVGILSQLGDISIKDLVKYLKEKNFTKVREWSIENSDRDIDALYRKLYDALYDHIEDKSKPELICILDDYQSKLYKDSEIHLLALLTKIMLYVEFV